MAVWDNDLAAVRRLAVDRHLASSYEDASDGTTLLALACQQGHEEIALHLVEQGADVNACTGERWSPLALATQGLCADAVEALAAAGADLEHECPGGLTALGVATQHGSGDLIHILLEAGAATDGGNPTPLAVAAECYEEAVASSDDEAAEVWQELLAMLQGGAEDADEDEGAEPLHEHDEEMQALVDAVTEADLASLESSIAGAKASGGADQLDELLNEPFDAAGTTLLWLAAQLGHDAVVSRLLQLGADVDGMGRDSTALLAATEYGHARSVAALLDAGATVDMAGADGSTPLHVAAEACACDCIELLTKHGAGADFVNDQGMTPLAVVRELVDEQGSSPELDEALRLLLAAGATEPSEDASEGLGADPVPGAAKKTARSKWKAAGTLAIAAERLRKTFVYVTTQTDDGVADRRVAIEIANLSSVTLPQLKAEVSAAVSVPADSLELLIGGVVLEAGSAALRSKVKGMSEITARDTRQSQVRSAGKSNAFFSGATQAAPQNFQSAEVLGLRTQVQQLQQQLAVRAHPSIRSATPQTVRRLIICARSWRRKSGGRGLQRRHS